MLIAFHLKLMGLLASECTFKIKKSWWTYCKKIYAGIYGILRQPDSLEIVISHIIEEKYFM